MYIWGIIPYFKLINQSLKMKYKLQATNEDKSRSKIIDNGNIAWDLPGTAAVILDSF
jgi:hypothetical protein